MTNKIIEMNEIKSKEYRLRTIARYNGLQEEDILHKNNDTGMWVFINIDEDYSENFSKRNEMSLQLSDSIVEQLLDDTFVDLDGYFDKSDESLVFKEADCEDDCDCDCACEYDPIQELRNEIKELRQVMSNSGLLPTTAK